ncbi:MAG: CNNM domain-containing protein [Rhabdochlamydiaceae bacterium]|nr:CNNM domain-containing protein [Candidatus Amphrikana amoebophyrae]
MSQTSWLFLLLTLFSIAFQAFFSMMEMAAVSFNKVRLQYYVSKGVKKAIWLNSLLNNPTRLFGTTLLCINAALQFGSECSRRFYSSIGLSPDWAPVSQIIVVVIFAELAPIFAARSYAEHVTLLGMRVLYCFSLLMRPFVWLIESVFKLVNWLFKITPTKHSFLSKDELQRAIEARSDRTGNLPQSEFENWISSLFATKNKIAKDFMLKLESIDMISSSSSVSDVRKMMKNRYHHYFPVYEKLRHQVVGVISPRDLLKMHDEQPITLAIKKPWFIPGKSSIFQIIREFRWNNQEIAMIVDEGGAAIGMITLDQTVGEIMPETTAENIAVKTSLGKTHILLDRSFIASSKLADICEQYQIEIPDIDSDATLEDLMEDSLKHPPGFGESIILGEFELKVVHSPLIGEKLISIRSL